MTVPVYETEYKFNVSFSLSQETEIRSYQLGMSS